MSPAELDQLRRETGRKVRYISRRCAAWPFRIQTQPMTSDLTIPVSFPQRTALLGSLTRVHPPGLSRVPRLWYKASVRHGAAASTSGLGSRLITC
ncbi:MAG: hypothetical protein M3082_01050 [Candidatus Dormibacteraeota bacterium]|nr:hypothetical protein [Candidatus Dormibacteraeota bacterium]